jgi:chromosome segregation ATPase
VARSVAIIEPDTKFASEVEQTFSSLGFETHVLSDGDVVEFVRQRGPSVILLNVELPKGSGYSFCNRLKKQQDLKRIPIILTSAQETAEAFAQHQKTPTPADAYMHKPISMNQLLDAVGRLVPEAFPNGAPLASQLPPPSLAPAPAPAPVDADEPAAERAPTAPPLRQRVRADAGRSASGPTFDELLAQGRADEPIAAPTATAGPEAKLAFLRESLRRREQDIARARELWSQRDREMGQLAEMLDLRERELERARKAREDLLSQLTAAEDRIGALRLDVELGNERADRLEREKKALAEELETASNDAESEIGKLTQQVRALEEALRSEQALRAEEGDRSATEIRDLVNDLETARADFARRDASARETAAQLNGQISGLQARIAELDVQLETTRGKLTDSVKDGEALKRELQALRQQKETDDAAFRATIDDLEGQLRDLQLDKDGLEHELGKTQSELAETRSRLEDRSNRVVDLEADLADTQGQLDETRNTLEQSKMRSAELSAELSDAQQHALELSQAKHRLEQKLQETTGELQATVRRLEETQAELEDTRKKATAHARELEGRITELKSALTDRDARLTEQAAVLAATEATLRDTETRLGDKTREWDQERVGRQKDVLKRDQRIADLEAKLKEVESAAYDAERQAKTREAALQHELDASRARADELDRDLNRARARGGELEALVQDSKEKINDLTRDLRKTEAQLTTAKEENAALNDQIDELTNALAEAREKAAFIAAELNEERANHSQDVQAHTANVDRLEKAMKERIEKLQEHIAKLKSDLGASQGELEDTKNRLQKVDEAKARLELQIEREQRDRQALSDRVSLLDEELEEALAKNESLQDEVTKLKTTAKRATDELMAMKRQRAELEAQFADKEESLFKKMEEQKSTIIDERQKVRAELEQAKKERDDVKARYAELHKKADTLLKRAKDGEQSAKERADAAEQRLNELVNDLRIEKEARAREKAQAEAAQEKLQKLLADATLKSSADAEGKLEAIKVQLKEREEKLAKLTIEASQYRERARDAIAKAKELETQLAGAGNDEVNKRAIEELKAKYNEVVARLKTQTDNNKQVNEKYRELADKYRKAVAIIEELKKRAAGTTGKPAPAPDAFDGDGDDMPAGEATVVLQNPLARKP